ncbi:hypothetical protein ES703_90260 [subsurface metagenome]
MVEKRRISPAVAIIPVGLGLALVVGLAAMAWAAPPKVYTCSVCGDEFATEEELLTHMELEHPAPPGLANLYGVVTDAETGLPLSGVKVSIDGLVVYTDASGNYGFEGLTPGGYTITFEKEGYETVTGDIVLAEGNNELNVALTPSLPIGLTILGVTAKRESDGSITVSIQWMHQGLNWGMPGEFFAAGAYFGDADTNSWGFYRETIGSPTPEGVPVITSIYFPWDLLTGMGEHPEEAYLYHDFRCMLTLYRDWQIWVASTEYIAEDII